MKYVKSATLVPAEKLAKILQECLSKVPSGSEVMLLDGFPRHIDQVATVENVVSIFLMYPRKY